MILRGDRGHPKRYLPTVKAENHLMSDRDFACSCGYLQRAAIDPNSPVSFDEEKGEFHVDHQLLFHYCPSCGGHAPDSIRKSLFVSVPPEESERLKNMMSELKSLCDVLKTFGPPNQESEQTWTSPGDCEVHHVRRAFSYNQISETAVVTFVERLDGHIDLLLHGKYIGK